MSRRTPNANTTRLFRVWAIGTAAVVADNPLYRFVPVWGLLMQEEAAG